jgi:hypothetical protein
MKIALQAVMLAVVVWMLGVPARADDRLTPETRASIHVIGVLVELGDQAEIKTIGITAFGNASSELPIGDWGFNDLARAEIQKVLAGAFVVKPAPVDAATMATIRDDIRNDKRVPRPSLLSALPASDIDAYLVLLPVGGSLPYPSNQSIRGLGVYREAGPSRYNAPFAGNNVIYVSYICAVISARTGKILGFSPALTANTDRPPQLFQMQPEQPRFPHLYVPGVDLPRPASSLPEDRKAEIKNDMSSLLTESIDYTLGKIGLVGAAPR